MIVLDHHIVPSRQRDDSARWLTNILGLPAPRREGPFAAIDLGGATSLYFAGWDHEVATQHYAFAVGVDEFDRIVDRLIAEKIEHWADPPSADRPLFAGTTPAAASTSAVPRATFSKCSSTVDGQQSHGRRQRDLPGSYRRPDGDRRRRP
jgi:hypothetical protein